MGFPGARGTPRSRRPGSDPGTGNTSRGMAIYALACELSQVTLTAPGRNKQILPSYLRAGGAAPGQRPNQFRRRRWEAVETVLGLSMTSSSVGWVLLDGPGADAATLDHDVFDFVGGSADDGDISKHIAAVRGSAGDRGRERPRAEVDRRHVDRRRRRDGEPAAESVARPGFRQGRIRAALGGRLNVGACHSALLSDSRRRRCVSSSLRPRRCCLSATAAVRTFATHMRESDDGLSRWLKDAFEINRVDPEHLFLIGSRGDLELISGRLSEALDMSVVTSNEAQLMLARGAALMVRSNAETVAVPLSGEQPATGKQNAAALALMAVAAVFVVGCPARQSAGVPAEPDQPASNSSDDLGEYPSRSGIARATSRSKNVIEPMVQPAPAPLPPSAPSPPSRR